MRALRTVAMFAMLGVIATTLVSWAFAALGSTPNRVGIRPGDSGPRFAKPGEVLPWPVMVPSRWPSPMMLDESAGRGLRLVYATCVTGVVNFNEPRAENRTQYQVASTQSGWPMLAMHATARTVRTGETDAFSRTPSIALPDWWQQFAEENTRGYRGRRALPLAPIWSGFLINTIMYACAFWLLLRSKPFLRAALRRRRHQCIACGYPIGENPVCTECGRAVNAKARRGKPDTSSLT